MSYIMHSQVLACLSPNLLPPGFTEESLTVFVVSLLLRAVSSEFSYAFKGQGVVFPPLPPPSFPLSQAQAALVMKSSGLQPDQTLKRADWEPDEKGNPSVCLSHLLNAVRRGSTSALELNASSLHSSHIARFGLLPADWVSIDPHVHLQLTGSLWSGKKLQ